MFGTAKNYKWLAGCDLWIVSALGKIMAMLGWHQTAFALTKANLVIGDVEVLMNLLKLAL